MNKYIMIIEGCLRCIDCSKCKKNVKNFAVIQVKKCYFD